MQNINESMTYETVLSLFSENYSKAFSFFSKLRESFDLSDPLPSFAGRISSAIGRAEEEIDEAWRRIRASYQAVRAGYEIIDQRSPFFPESLLDSEYPVPFLYALGNLRLLEKERLTVIGSLGPSEEGARIAEDTASFINSNSLVLLTPLRLGVSSLAIADTLRGSGSVIAFSSSFVTKAPNERLRDQMADIYRRGGLILSASGPALRENKWHQVIRNRALSVLSDSVFMIEEKDGGPAWKIFDAVSPSSKRMVSSHFIGREGYSFISHHLESGAMEYRSQKDLKKLISKKERQARIKTDLSLTPDLF